MEACSGSTLCRLFPATALVLGVLWLAGCAVGPRYARPSATIPPEFKETPPHWKAAQPSDQIAKGKWWEVF